MNNVVRLECDTRLPIPPDTVLDAAKEQLDEVVIIGFETGAYDVYLASSTSDLSRMLVLLERAKGMIMRKLDAM
jgi:hypothetical protein